MHSSRSCSSSAQQHDSCLHVSGAEEEGSRNCQGPAQNAEAPAYKEAQARARFEALKAAAAFHEERTEDMQAGALCRADDKLLMLGIQGESVSTPSKGGLV